MVGVREGSNWLDITASVLVKVGDSQQPSLCWCQLCRGGGKVRGTAHHVAKKMDLQAHQCSSSLVALHAASCSAHALKSHSGCLERGQPHPMLACSNALDLPIQGRAAVLS